MKMNGWQSTVRVSERSTGVTSLQVFSGGFLQPYQPSLRIDHRILLPTIMSRDEGHRRVCYDYLYLHAQADNFAQVRVPLAGFRELQKTDQNACTDIYRAFDGMGPKQY